MTRSAFGSRIVSASRNSNNSPFASLAPKFLANSLVNRVKNSLELAITLAGADHKVVRNRVQVVQVQHHDIAGQFVFGKLNRSPR